MQYYLILVNGIDNPRDQLATNPFYQVEFVWIHIFTLQFKPQCQQP